jgi:predicted HTH domain antitoxin
MSLTLDLPEELVRLLGSPERTAERAREALVLDLLRHAEISQGKAAELLGINRYEMLDRMARHKIPSGPQTAEEAEQEIEAAIRLAQRT